MTKAEERKHLALRQKVADQIMINPALFKVCEQCTSIAVADAADCPICSAYRFNYNSAAVCASAKKLAKTPYPTMVAVVPRIHFK